MKLRVYPPSADSEHYRGRDWSIPELIERGFASRAQIYRLIAASEINAYRVGDRTRIRGASIDTYIERHTVTPRASA